MSGGEEAATEAWKGLTALNVPNVYLLAGGLNYWLDVYGHAGHEACPTTVATSDGSAGSSARTPTLIHSRAAASANFGWFIVSPRDDGWSDHRDYE